MAEGSSYRGPRVAVIGSGFGGLATAIRLQAAGVQTVVFEARDKPGGCAYVYEQDGFIFDGGPTVITAPHCIEELFALAGRSMTRHVEMLPVEPFYRLLFHDGCSLEYGGDGDALLAQIRERSEEDAAGYLRFVEHSRRAFEKGYEELVDVPFLRFADMVKVAPELARLRADRSVYSTVARYIRDENLRKALSFHSLLIGGNPFETSSLYTLIHYLERKWGVFFPRGGTGALVRALVDLFRDVGGEIHLETRVRSVRVESGSSGPKHLVTGDGRVDEPFDAVVSNADLHHTYGTIYRDHSAAQGTRRRLEKLDWSMSLYVLYFGTDRTWDHLAHHTVLFGPRYREHLEEVFDGPLSDDFSLYLHAPTVTDESLAPPGCGSFYVLSPVPHLGNADLDWDAMGDDYGNRILEALECHMPGLRSHVVTRRSLTPRGFERDLFTYQGSAFSVAPKLTQSAWFRPHNRDPRIPGLYIAGAGTHPGAGLPGVINSGKATARVLLADLLGVEAP